MGVIIAACVTTLLAAAAFGYLIRRMTAPEDRRVALIAVLVMLPMQPLTFYLVRMLLHDALEALLGKGALLTVITLFYAPLNEEPAKWLVLLIPFIR